MKYYLSKWYFQIFLVLVICFICIFTLGIPHSIAFYISVALPAMAVLISGLIGIIRLFKKEYVTGTLQVLLSAGIGISGMLFLWFHLMFYPYDHFANGLEIPENIALNIPKDSITAGNHKNLDFEIYKSFQPGIYTYAVWLKNPEPGTIYLRAYEVTQNTPLSAERLPERSSVAIKAIDTLSRYSLKKDDSFTIYEGDWGQYYAARFELWYAPADGGKEKKLAEKIYKIEGWMR